MPPRGATWHLRARRWRAAGVVRPQALRRVSTTPSSTGESSPESSTASHNAARARSALAPASPLAATTPSIMSATTADHGHPFSWTATVGTPPRNRSVRCTPSNPGGDRNPGTTRERRRAACPSERAAAAREQGTQAQAVHHSPSKAFAAVEETVTNTIRRAPHAVFMWAAICSFTRPFSRTPAS